MKEGILGTTITNKVSTNGGIESHLKMIMQCVFENGSVGTSGPGQASFMASWGLNPHSGWAMCWSLTMFERYRFFSCQGFLSPEKSVFVSLAHMGMKILLPS